MCVIADCGKPNFARGMCQMHHCRAKKHGDPHYVRPVLTVAQSIAQKSKDSGACRAWTAGRDDNGYGRFYSPHTKERLAHRAAYEDAHGPIPAGLDVCHTCDNPPCILNAHLFLGTHADNMADRDAKGRVARGETSGTSKLNEAEVRSIRRLVQKGLTRTEIAAQVGVSRAAVSMIASGKRWRHVDL